MGQSDCLQNPADALNLKPQALETVRSKTTRSSPDDRELLSCPYRKRNPLRFNIRDHPACVVQGFGGFPKLREHIFNHHILGSNLKCLSCGDDFRSRDDLREHVTTGKACGLRNVVGVDHEDGICNATGRLLAEADEHTTTAKGIWSMLFPNTEIILLDFTPPIEHFELLRVQEDYLSQLSVAEMPKESRLSPDILAFVTVLLRDFVRVTSEALHTSKTVTSGGSKREDTKPGPLSDDIADTKTGVVKMVESGLDKLDPETLGRIRCLGEEQTISHECDKIQGAISAHGPEGSWDEHGSPGPPQNTWTDKHVTGIFTTDPEKIATTAETISPATICQTPDDRPEGLSDPETDREAQLCDVLRFSYDTLFKTKLEVAAKGPFALDNLVEAAKDFADKLATALLPSHQSKSTDWGTTNVGFTSTGGACQGGSSSLPVSSGGSGRNMPGNDDDMSRSPGDSGRGHGRPGGQGPFSGNSNTRLPCPFRMADPVTFNVRDHYSCSMTFFRSPAAVREHLRLQHSRSDGASVACLRCYEGFPSMTYLGHHNRSHPSCDLKIWKSNLKLGLERNLPLKGNGVNDGTEERAWEELCEIVFREQVKVSSEYRVVIEYFEFAKLLFESIPELTQSLSQLGLMPEHTVLSDTLMSYFKTKMDDFELGGKYQSTLDDVNLGDVTIVSDDSPSIDLSAHTKQTAGVFERHFGSLLNLCDEMSRTMPYENLQGRRGGKSTPRQRGAANSGLPTPQSADSTRTSPAPKRRNPASRLERPAKRAKLAPKAPPPSEESNISGNPSLQEHCASAHQGGPSTLPVISQNFAQERLLPITPAILQPETPERPDLQLENAFGNDFAVTPPFPGLLSTTAADPLPGIIYSDPYDLTSFSWPEEDGHGWGGAVSPAHDARNPISNRDAGPAPAGQPSPWMTQTAQQPGPHQPKPGRPPKPTATGSLKRSGKKKADANNLDQRQ